MNEIVQLVSIGETDLRRKSKNIHVVNFGCNWIIAQKHASDEIYYFSIV